MGRFNKAVDPWGSPVGLVGRLNKAVDPWGSSVGVVGRLNKAVDPWELVDPSKSNYVDPLTLWSCDFVPHD